MGSMVSGLAEAVLGVAEGVGLSSNTVARYGKFCEAVVEFCDRRDVDALSVRVVDEFVAYQYERARRGEIGRNRRNALVRSARMMLESQRTGAVAWRVMSRASATGLFRQTTATRVRHPSPAGPSHAQRGQHRNNPRIGVISVIPMSA
jgi:hypothetical protein